MSPGSAATPGCEPGSSWDEYGEGILGFCAVGGFLGSVVWGFGFRRCSITVKV